MRKQVAQPVGQGESIDQEKYYRLVERCGKALANPIFIAIAMEAQSSWMADTYGTRHLHWPNIVGQQLRAAANLHLNYSLEAWEHLAPRNANPADSMFLFQHHPVLPKKILCSSAVKFGGHTEEYSPKWPLLLREFKYLVGKNTVLTTVDHMANPATAFIRKLDPDEFLKAEQFFCSTNLSSGLTYPDKIGKFSFAIVPNAMNGYRLINDEYAIYGRTIGVAGNAKIKPSDFLEDSVFPRVFKVLEIKSRKNLGNGYDRIRIYIRQDLSPNVPGGNIGRLVFERVLPVCYGRLWLKLTMQYVVKRSGHMYRDYDHTELVSWCRPRDKAGRPDRHELVPTQFPVELGSQFLDLCDFASRAWNKQSGKGGQRDSFFDLDPIAGISFLTNPPPRLGDLFC